MIDPSTVRVGNTYTRNGETFEVTDLYDFVTKSPGDANWSSAVGYLSVSAGDGRTYVRTLNDFCNKFEPTPEDEANT